MSATPGDGAQPLGFNLEGPFLAPGCGRPRSGAACARRRRWRRRPGPAARRAAGDDVAPSCPARWSSSRGSRRTAWRRRSATRGATLDEARAGYAAGARIHDAPVQRDDRRRPQVAGPRRRRAARRRRYVELIADGNHVHPALWPLIARTKPSDRLRAGLATRCRSPGREPGAVGSAGSNGGPRRPRDRGRDRHAGRVRHRARHRGAQARPRGPALPVAVAARRREPGSAPGRGGDRGRHRGRAPGARRRAGRRPAGPPGHAGQGWIEGAGAR